MSDSLPYVGVNLNLNNLLIKITSVFHQHNLKKIEKMENLVVLTVTWYNSKPSNYKLISGNENSETEYLISLFFQF